jgi:hypothetical protein
MSDHLPVQPLVIDLKAAEAEWEYAPGQLVRGYGYNGRRTPSTSRTGAGSESHGCRLDRPGAWMYHCPIIEHHAAGMMAPLRSAAARRRLIPPDIHSWRTP